MTSEKKFFSPTLYPRTRTHIKGEKWFIKYFVKDYAAGKLRPMKYRGYLNLIEDFEEREKEAAAIIQMMENNITPPDAKGARRLPPIEPHNNFANISRVLEDTLKLHEREFYTEPGKVRFQNLKTKSKTLSIWLQKSGLDKLTIGKFGVPEGKEFLSYLIHDKKLSIKTRNSYKIDLGLIWKLIIADGKITNNPWQYIPCDRVIIKKSFAKLPEYVQAIIEKEMPAYDMQLYIVCLLIYACYMRPIEINRIKISAIDFDKEVIRISDEVCLKSGSREVPIPLELIEIFKKENYHQYDEDDYVFSTNGKPGKERQIYHYLRNKWSDFREKFNIPEKYKLYGLKHTGNTKFSLVGINARTLQKLNGHHSLEHIQKNYTGELSVEDIMFVRNHQPKLGEVIKPVIQHKDEQTEMLKQILAKLETLRI